MAPTRELALQVGVGVHPRASILTNETYQTRAYIDSERAGGGRGQTLRLKEVAGVAPDCMQIHQSIIKNQI